MVLNESNYGTPELHTEDDVDGHYVWTGLIDHFEYATGTALDGQYMTVYEENTGVVGFNSEDDVDNNASDVDGTADLGTETSFPNARGTVLDSQYMTIREFHEGGSGGGGLQFETIKVTNVGTSWTNVNFANTYTDPVVTATLEIGSGHNPDNMAIDHRADAVTSTGCNVKIAVPDYQNGDGTVLNGIVYLFVIEAGSWDVAGLPKIQAGTHTTSTVVANTYGGAADQVTLNSTLWSGVSQAEFFVTVGTESASATGSKWISAWVNGGSRTSYPTTSAFHISMSSAEVTPQDNHPSETLHWLVIENGVFNHDGMTIQAGRTADTIEEYTHNNLVNHNLGGTPAWGVTQHLRMDGNNGGWSNWEDAPFSSTQIEPYMQEDRYADSETGHISEPFSYLVCTDDSYAKTSIASENYKIDFEYQWTDATLGQTNAEVCIYVGSHTNGTEDLKVQYYNGGWQDLGTVFGTLNNDWANFTVSDLTQVYTIRFLGVSETSDTAQDQWEIDLVTLHTWTVDSTNYELDVKFEWTNADFSADHAELCIFVFNHNGTESLRVDEWIGSWSALGTISSTGWYNFTTTNAGASNYTIRFVGLGELSDTYRDDWKIDLITLHTWDNAVPNCMVNVEFLWDDVGENVDDVKLCIWLPVSGSELLNVEYYSSSSTWEPLGTLSQTGWNNFTVTDYLTWPSQFKMRLVGADEISDTDLDSWDIDAMILRASDLITSATEYYYEADTIEWHTNGIAMTVISTSIERYAQLNATENLGPLTATWDISDQSITDEWLVMRWRYDSQTAPITGDYEIILKHDGDTSAAINLLNIAGASGTSSWFVLCAKLSELVPGIEALESIELRAKTGAMQVEYVAIGMPGVATAGVLLPQEYTGTLSVEAYGFSVVGSSEASFTFNKADMPVEDRSAFLMVANMGTAFNYYLVLHGLYDDSPAQAISHQILDFVDGWNEISLNLSDVVDASGIQMDIIMSIEILVNSGTNPFIGLDSLWVGISHEFQMEEGADYIDIIGYNDEAGITLYDLSTFDVTTSPTVIDITADSWYSTTALLDMFIATVNYSASGPATDIVAFLEDGVPMAIDYQPRPNLHIYTTGHDLNLHVVTDSVDFMVGEDESTVLLDTLNITEWSSYRIQFDMTGWFEGVSINRSFSVTSSGVINWTTSYGDGGTSIESVDRLCSCNEFLNLKSVSLGQ